MKDLKEVNEELTWLRKAMEGSQREIATLKRRVQETRDMLDTYDLDSFRDAMDDIESLKQSNRTKFSNISAGDSSDSGEFEVDNSNGVVADTVRDENGKVEFNKEMNRVVRNAYTFLICSKFRNVAMQLGILVVMVQYTLFLLFLADLLNTQQIPPDIGVAVRITQVICIFVGFLAQYDVRTSLRALIYREGTDIMAEKFPGFSMFKFMLVNCIMLAQGLLGVATVIVLTVYSDNVFDLLLNFTAVMFVSELDELVFLMALLGFVGRKSEKLAKQIQQIRFPLIQRKGWVKYIHIFIFLLFVTAGYGYYFSIISLQTNEELLPKFIKVEFGDNVDPTLGLYSGCYKIEEGPGWSVRVRYAQAQPQRLPANFEYCNDDDIRSWIFTPGGETSCDNPYLRSSEERPTSFDVLDTKGDQWLLRDGTPISKFQLAEVDPDRFETECGDILSRPGKREELCFSLTMDALLKGFEDSHKWSKNFELLEDQDIVTYYQHPVFIGEFSQTEGHEVVFFTGRRWILSSATRLLGNKRANRADLIDWFRSDEPRILTPSVNVSRPYAFVSEPVAQATHQGTPMGLRWYSAQYSESVKFAFADVSLPSDALFRCGNCDAETNPCRYEGICNSDGSCTCRNRANGTLCDVRPLSDGVCDYYFNSDVHLYDGGDCCAATCTADECRLVKDTDVAFGQKLTRTGTSFPQCIDPKLNRLTIELSSTVEDLAGNFEFYTVKIVCQEGKETPLKVSLDPKISGNSSQTIHVADSTASCELSVSGIQSWSKLSVSFEVLDTYFKDRIVMKKFENITNDRVLRLPPVYNGCLKSTLKHAVNPTELYSDSYRDRAVAWLHNETSGNDKECEEDERLIERYALVAMSYAMVSPGKNWITSQDHCFWTERLSCRNDRVTTLFYDGENNGPLEGTWAEEFTLLTSLESIDVFKNENLQGTLPSTLGDLTSLKIFLLAENAIAGTIPSQLGLLTNLIYCGLWTNALEGTVPTEIGDIGKLSELYLYNNRLTGQIPTQIGNLRSLEYLYLFNNLLSGSIPEVSRHSSLKAFDLRTNRISGTLPPSLGLHTELLDISLYDNLLTGSIPLEYSSLTDLEFLRLENNRLSGEIEPSFFGSWSNLLDLRLSNQFFSGRLPTTIGGLRAIETLYLDHNAFGGPLPTELSGLRNLTKLYLDSNLFTGVFNIELTNMPLQVLRLQNNTLKGAIPTEIGLLSDLYFLSLADNLLSGSLPSEIGLLTNLTYLHLEGNSLGGTIPDEVLNLTNLRKIELSNNLWSEEEVNRIVSALDLDFSCDETTVEILLTSDQNPEDTWFEITTPDGAIVAKGGGFSLDRYGYDETTCVPANACKFTIFDEFADGGASVEVKRLGKAYRIDGTFREKKSIDICS